MASDLTEIQERIQWCKDKSVVLISEIGAFIESGAYRLSHEIDAKTGETTIFVEIVTDPPLRFAIEFGHIVHELRAILDALACVLAVRNGKGTKNVYFAISRNLTVFELDGLKKKLANLSQADRDVIATLKPYEDGNPMLFALHSADLLRKHQRLIMNSSGVGYLGIRSGYATSIRLLSRGPLTRKRKPIVVIGAGSDLDTNIVIDIHLSEPPGLRRRPVAAVLHNFTSLTQSIVQLFV